jgi:hypothetical protein
MNSQPAVKFTQNIEGKEIKTCDPNSYEEMCQNFNCFEVIPDDRKVKPYFDIEIKPKHCEDNQDYVNCWQEIVKYAIEFIDKHFPNAEYCIKNASSPDYICCKTQNHTWITSSHIIIWNYKITKSKLKSIVMEINKEVNKNINNEKDSLEKVTDFYFLKKNKDDDKYLPFDLLDKSIYNEKGKMRSAYARKSHYDKETKQTFTEDRPSMIEFGTFEQSVISEFIPDDAFEINDDVISIDDNTSSTSSTSSTKSKSNSSSKSVYQKIAETQKENANDNLEKLSFFMKNGFDKCCKCHEDIVKIGYALANEFKEDGLILFLTFAEEYTSHSWEDVQKEYNSKYDTFLKKNNGNCSIGTIYWIFKKFDSKLYSAISKEWNFNHYKIDMINNVIFTGAVADYFKNLYGDFICACDEITYIYNGVRWVKSDKTNSELIRFIDKVFYKDLIEYGENRMAATTKLLHEAETEEESDIINTKIKNIQLYLKNAVWNMRNSGARQGYIKDIIAFSTNNNIKFDSNKFLFAFNNKIYDLNKKCFVEPDPSQYISKSCGYDYNDTYDKKYITELSNVIDSVFPNKEIKEYYLTYLSTGLSGIHMEEFMIATGVGGNGKSMINGLMMNTIGEYGYEVPSIAFTKEIKDGPNAELACLHNVRFALTSEPDIKKKFCCSTIKSITGNDTLAVRLLHSNKVGIDLLCSIVCEGNDIPDFDEVNQAVNRRVRASVFETVAIDKSDYDKLDEDDKICGKYTIKNPYYKTFEFKEQYRQAFFHILCDYFETFQNNNYSLTAMPSKCKSKVVSLFAASDGIYSWFEEIYEAVSKEDYATSVPIPISEVYSKFSSSTYFMRLPKTEQRKLNRKNFVEKVTTNLFLQKSLKLRKMTWNKQQLDWDALVGWKIKPENDN